MKIFDDTKTMVLSGNSFDWECRTCDVMNTQDMDLCTACGSSRDVLKGKKPYVTEKSYDDYRSTQALNDERPAQSSDQSDVFSKSTIDEIISKTPTEDTSDSVEGLRNSFENHFKESKTSSVSFEIGLGSKVSRKSKTTRRSSNKSENRPPLSKQFSFSSTDESTKKKAYTMPKENSNRNTNAEKFSFSTQTFAGLNPEQKTETIFSPHLSPSSKRKSRTYLGDTNKLHATEWNSKKKNSEDFSSKKTEKDTPVFCYASTAKENGNSGKSTFGFTFGSKANIFPQKSASSFDRGQTCKSEGFTFQFNCTTNNKSNTFSFGQKDNHNSKKEPSVQNFCFGTPMNIGNEKEKISHGFNLNVNNMGSFSQGSSQGYTSLPKFQFVSPNVKFDDGSSKGFVPFNFGMDSTKNERFAQNSFNSENTPDLRAPAFGNHHSTKNERTSKNTPASFTPPWHTPFTSFTSPNFDQNKPIGFSLTTSSKSNKKSQISTLTLSLRKEGDRVKTLVLMALKRTKTVREIILSNKRSVIMVKYLDQDDAIIENLKKMDTTNILYIHHDGSSEEVVAFIIRILGKKNKNVVTIKVCDNGIDDAGATHIAKFLNTNSSLRNLDLGDNKIGNDGAKAIIEALEGDVILHDLNLTGNNIDKNILKYISDLVAKSDKYSNHLEELKRHGPSFYIATNDNDDDDNDRLSFCAVVWEECFQDTGRNLILLEKALRVIIGRDDDDHVACAAPSSKLLELCSPPDFSPLVNLVNKSDLLRRAASKSSSEAASFCLFLCRELRVDFDRRVDDDAVKTPRDVALDNDENKVMRCLGLSFGTVLDRYHIPGWPNANAFYRTETSTFHTAVDLLDKSRSHVLLEMTNKVKHFRNELRLRLRGDVDQKKYNGKDLMTIDNEEDANIHDNRYVFPLLRYHDAVHSSQEWHILVTPLPGRTLDYILRYDFNGSAGSFDEIKKITLDIASALHHVHVNGKICCFDLTPHRVVRVEGQRHFCLWGLSKGVKLGEKIEKGNDESKNRMRSSTPPEYARWMTRPKGFKLDDLKSRRDELKLVMLELEDDDEDGSDRYKEILNEFNTVAERIQNIRKAEKEGMNYSVRASHDVWSFGVLLYRMLTGTDLFRCDDWRGEMYHEEDKKRLVGWKGLTDEELKRGLLNCDCSDVALAKDLLKGCLTADPYLRFVEMAQVLNHDFLLS